MENINYILENLICENQIEGMDDFSYLYSFLNIIDIYTPTISYLKYKNRISLSKSILYTEKFLDFLSPFYREKFDIELKAGNIFFQKTKKSERSNALAFSDYINWKPYLYIPYDGTIRDTYTLTHELIHDISLEPDVSFSRCLFCEVFSLTAEKLQKEYFQKYMKVKDYGLNEKENVMALVQKTKIVKFELALLSEFFMIGYLTNDKILDLLWEFGKEEIESIFSHFQKICTSQIEFSFLLDQRYILGSVLASYIYNNILEGQFTKEEFVQLNDLINHYTIEDFLDYLDLGYKDSSVLKFEEKTYQKLKTAYRKDMKRLG